MARDEREELAGLLDRLTPQQWDSPTLCELWSVREVAVHTVSYDELDMAGTVRRFLKGRLSSARINAICVADYADRSPEQIVAMIRANTEPHGLTAGFGGRIALTDGMIHQQDIRRSIGVPRTIESERLRTALDFARFAPTIRGAWRARGVRLVATDLDWAHGKGPEVRGSGEALLMAMAGRRAALADLDGPGKVKLAQRF
ncbi:MAG TPA: maleylpyruvate isomerase family mycothiol-dependent enzyme [Mycobacterium sp.]|nr:maleylpyruvate isomerase family mycothiol-dependent enzyme [Mycobacterium sp.]